MLKKFSQYIIDSVENKFNDVMDSLNKLSSYNRSDSPAFSQIGSIASSIESLAMENDYNKIDNKIDEILKHPVQLLNDKDATEDNWDGAPLAVIVNARNTFSDYKRMIKNLKYRE